MNYPHPLIAREGWPFLIVTAILAIVLQSYGLIWFSVLVWFLFIFELQFFRDPPRFVPAQENWVSSPADGRIVSVERTQNPYTQQEALKISVFMNVFNVHSNRIAVAGTVESVAYYPGSFFNADLDKASLQNERNAVVIKTKSGAQVTLVQVAGLVARRILCYVKTGDQLEKGQRYGFIRFGSRVDVYLPHDSVPKVAIGDKVMASTTVLAELAS